MATGPRPYFRADELSFRPIVERDVDRIVGWLNDPKVGEWWEGVTVNYDQDYVRQEFLAGSWAVTRAIVELAEEPLGFQQWYPIDASHEAELLDEYGIAADAGAYGIDQFIGVSALHGQGLGTRQVCAITDWLLGPDGPGAERVVTDPIVENLRAVRCYERAGFRTVRRLSGHEALDGVPRDCWLMERALVATKRGS